MLSECQRCGASSFSLRKKCPTCKGCKTIYQISVQDPDNSRTTHVYPGLTTFGDILRRFSMDVGHTYFEIYDEYDRTLGLETVVTEEWLMAHNGHLHVLSKNDQIERNISSLGWEIYQGRHL